MSALFTIHGIGQQKDGYANDFLQLVGKYCTKTVYARPFCWQPEVEQTEQHVLSSLDGLWWPRTRKMFVSYVGDAIMYQSTGQEGDLYSRVHQKLDQSLKSLLLRVPKSEKLVIVAHSLGSIILSNYLWDVLNPSSKGNSSFQASTLWTTKLLSKLKAVVAIGSPLAIWAQRFPNGGTPLDLKGPKWYNIYSPADILAYPVRTINSEYAASETFVDMRVRCGGLLTFWNPGSHNSYWDSKYVAKFVAGLF